MLMGTLVFFLSLATRTQPEDHGVFFKIEENSFLFHQNSIWDGKAASLVSCLQMCARQAACKSVNFMANQGTCSLLSEKQTKQAEKPFKRDGAFYLEKVCYQYSFFSHYSTGFLETTGIMPLLAKRIQIYYM